MKYDPIEHGSLNDFVRWRADVAYEEWWKVTFADCDFSGWERFRAWLLQELGEEVTL